MNRKCVHRMLAIALVLVLRQYADAQSSFQNLDFESPVTPLLPDASSMVPITDALPGWSGYIGGTSVTQVVYDTVALDAAAISLHDATSPEFTPLQGNYSVFLQGSSSFAPTASAAIGQTGLIPFGSQSITFFGQGILNLQMTFNNRLVPFSAIGTGATYTIYGGDISAFAGQTGELLFTALPQGDGLLDNIQFSSEPVPEPTMLCLAALVGLLFALTFRSRM